jgi:hypothetical protein
MTLDGNMMAVLVILIALLALAAALHWRRHESHVLHKHFGPEYDRTVERLGSRTKAEHELRERRERVDKLELKSLSPEEAARFHDSWTRTQARFVDDPKAALAEADLLVRELMQKRGYPMGDFERRAGDISVHYPHVVDHYRAAHDIALRDSRGETDTEQQRQAVIHYRALFTDLLEVERPREMREEMRRPA